MHSRDMWPTVAPFRCRICGNAISGFEAAVVSVVRTLGSLFNGAPRRSERHSSRLFGEGNAQYPLFISDSAEYNRARMT